MARGAKHLPETRLTLRYQFRILTPGGNNAGIDLVGYEGFGFLNAEVSGEPAEFALGQTILRHARLFLHLVAIHRGIAVLVEDRARFFQPLVDPLATNLRPDVCEIWPEHPGTSDSRQEVAALAIQFGEKLATACQLRGFCELILMAGTAGSLDEPDRQQRLLPGACGVVRFRHLGCWTLSAMANHAAPRFHVVANRRMWPKRRGDSRCASQTRLRDCQVARGAAIHHAEFREPDLLNSTREMALQGRTIRPGREKFHVLPLVMPPFLEKVFGRCNRQGDQEQEAGPGKTMRRRIEEKPAQPPGSSWRAQEFLQGHTQTQPGPRKSAPTAVRITASIKNHVMIQNESGFAP